MSIPKHIKEHAVLGLTEPLQQWDGVQRTLGARVFPINHGAAAANFTMLSAGAVHMMPFMLPAGASQLGGLDFYAENNSGTSADKVWWAVWDGNGNLLGSGTPTKSLTTNGVKSITSLSIPIPTRSLWIGINTFEDGVGWAGIEVRTGSPIAVPGMNGFMQDLNHGTAPTLPFVIVLADPTDPVPDPITPSDFITSAAHPSLVSVGAIFS